MPTVIGFVSEKGGVGKTTAVYHIAVALRRHHQSRVLVLDTDYQRGGITCRLIPALIEHFRTRKMDGNTLHTSYRALYTETDPLPTLTIRETSVNVDLIPSDPRLNTISIDKMPAPDNLRHGNQMLLRHLLLIRESLQPFADAYDYILIDSHPDLHDLERAVIAASDYIVSPVKLDNQSAVGVASTIRCVNEVNEDVNAVLSISDSTLHYNATVFLGALGMMCREYGQSLKYSEQLIYNRLSSTTTVLDSYVTEGDGLRIAAQDHIPVYDVTHPNAYKQSHQFRSVTRELLDHVP